MAKNTRWSSDDFKRKGLIQVAGGNFVPADRVTDGVKKKVIVGAEKKPEGFIEDYKLVIGERIRKEIDAEKSVNKKIKGAVKVEIDGIMFDSRTEGYMYTLLKGANIHFERQVEYQLQAPFRYRDKAVRAITLTVDYFLPLQGILIDVKGFHTQQGDLRYKMLKSVLKHLMDSEPEIEMPKNKKDCDLLLNKLLYDK